MNGPGTVVVIVAAVAAYLSFLGGMIYFAVRWSRRVLSKKSAALQTGLDAAGGKKVAEAKAGGLYTGAEVEYEVGGRRVFTNAYYVSRSFVRVNLRIPSGPYPWVLVFPEGKVDRLGKALGVNREVQTGDQAFDDLAYVDTIDTDENVSQLLANPQARDGLRELLSLGYRAQFSDRGVEAFQIVYALTAVDGSQAGRAAAALERVAAAAPKFPADKVKVMRVWARGLAAALLLVPLIAGAIIAGATSMFSLRTLDHGDVLLAFLGSGGACWVLYVLALASYLRGRSYAMRLLLIGAAVGMFGVIGAGGGLTLTLNQVLDSSKAVERSQVLLSKHKYRAERTVTVSAWRAGHRDERLKVSSATWDKVEPGMQIFVRERAGAFGWPWVESLSETAALAIPPSTP